MTLNEAITLADDLATINLKIWDAKSTYEKNELRSKFRDCYRSIVSNGYRIRRSREFDSSRGYRVPKYKICKQTTNDCVNIVDNRSENGNHHGDCTTRCISFCTGEDYLTIQREQMANAAKANAIGKHYTWRNIEIWSKSLTTRGFCQLILPRKVTRRIFLKMFNNCGIDSGIIATKSSGHLAAIDMKTKKILDTWNSAGGRIQSIFVPVDQKYAWTVKLNSILG